MSKFTRFARVAAAASLVALVVPASSAQPRVEVRPRAMELLATPAVASYASGGGISFLRAEVDAQGHLALESPRGVALTGFEAYQEGYALCTGGDTASAIDLPVSEGHGVRGFAAASVSQPTPGAFPVTITRTTTDGRFKLTQRWAPPDATEKDVTVTMILKNLGTTTASGIELIRSTEAHSNYGDLPPLTIGASGDSVWQWWTPGTPVTHGLMMTARTLGVPHEGGFPTDIDLPDICGSYYDPGPDALSSGGYARIAYFLPDLAPGRSVTAAVVYRRI